MRMKVFWFGTLLVAALGAAGFGGCTHAPAVDPNIGPAPAFVSGTYDCSAASTWTTSTFAGLVPSVQRAVANDNPENALTGLLRTHAAQEVTCVAGYVHDESMRQQATATDKDLAGKRVAATQAWLDHQSARGLIVTNYTGDTH
jgi:hypothetical protein